MAHSRNACALLGILNPNIEAAFPATPGPGPLTISILFTTCWRLHAASRHSVDWLRTARQFKMYVI
ncbi:hypothetical protein [Citrobacter sp. SL156]